MKKLMIITATLLLTSSIAMANDGDILLNEYIQQGYKPNASAGKAFWNKEFNHVKSGQQRSCATCHTSQLTKEGKHAKTDKLIKPMAPSVNRERLTKRKKINKWFKRNCKWTLGRECTLQEKADTLAYLKTL